MPQPDVFEPPHLPEETPTEGFPLLTVLIALLAVLTATFLFVKLRRRRE